MRTRRFADEIEALRLIRSSETERIESVDLPEVTPQRFHNLPLRKGDFLDFLMEQFVIVPGFVLENFDVPFESSAWLCVDFDDC